MLRPPRVELHRPPAQLRQPQAQLHQPRALLLQHQAELLQPRPELHLLQQLIVILFFDTIAFELNLILKSFLLSMITRLNNKKNRVIIKLREKQLNLNNFYLYELYTSSLFRFYYMH